MPAVTARAVGALAPNPESRYIGGPLVAVPESVRTRLGIPAFNRIYDEDDPSRYATARAIAEHACAEGWVPVNDIGVANRLPDALTGGSGMGKLGGPVLYTPASFLHRHTREFIADNKASIGMVSVLGGPRSITAQTYASIVSALR